MIYFAYDLDHGATLHDAQNEAWLDTKEPANAPEVEYPPEQCHRCGEPMKHGGYDGHQCS